MSDFNKVILLGRVGNNPELKNSAEGKPYLKLSLATNQYRPGKERATSWHRVMVFGVQAQACATYLKKGSQIMVDGVLTNSPWVNAEGKKVSQVSILADHVKFLGPKLQDRDAEEVLDGAALDHLN